MKIAFRTAWGFLVLAMALSAGELVRGQAQNTVKVEIPPEAYLLVIGAAVTIGINLEQLRRVRGDNKGLSDAVTKNGEKNDKRHVQMEIRLSRIETGLEYLKNRRRHDREYPIEENS